MMSVRSVIEPWIALIFVNFLTTWITLTDQQHGARVDRKCRIQGSRKTAGFRSRLIYTG